MASPPIGLVNVDELVYLFILIANLFFRGRLRSGTLESQGHIEAINPDAVFGAEIESGIVPVPVVSNFGADHKYVIALMA
jgi:hypothetical protein